MTIPGKLHFIGVGGAGMAPLAKIVMERGGKVSGSDESFNPELDKLKFLGADIHIGHAAGNVPPDCEMLVYSSAVPPENPERAEGRKRQLPELRRGELLALIAANYRRVVAISGSHGKSSTTAMLAHIAATCGMTPGFMIGAKVCGGEAASAGKNNDIFITEADESDGTHKLLHPYLGIIPNFDSDHSWSVGGEAALKANFKSFAANSQQLLCGDSAICRELFGDHADVRFLAPPEKGFAGFLGFQAVNAFNAVTAAETLGADRSEAIKALASFRGIARRMQIYKVTPHFTVIEDYAHHPEEVASALALLRQTYPQRHIRAVFQPHRYARLEKYFDDFAAILRQADSVIVTEVFAAWSETGNVDGAKLAAAIPGALYGGGDFRKIAAAAVADLPENSVIAILGAGSINKVLEYL